MVATDSAMGSANRERISSVLERAEVRAQLEAYGVNVKEARARVAALTDDEAAELVARMDQLPAAGLYAVGTTILVFCLLIFMFWLKAAH